LERLKHKIVCHSLDQMALKEFFRAGKLQVGSGMIQYVKSLIEDGWNIGYTTNMKEGFFSLISTLAKVKNHSGSSELINAFLNKALSKEAQIGLARDLWYSPVISDVDVYKLFPIEIANRIYLDYSRAIKIDWNYVYEMHPVWMKRRLDMGF